MSTTAIPGRSPRPLTGRMVLLYFVTFFGVIFAVNFYMVRVAISSFSGVETESVYKAGLSFKNDVEAAHTQDALRWKIEADLHHGAAPEIVVAARDAQGQALAGLLPEIRLAHPTDKRRDVPLEFVEQSPGRFRSVTPMPEGQWDLVIGLKRNEETVFRSKSRIVL
ncbi:FixH family protein [Microvirga lotononidis]|uniref:Putative integral membrane protein linked to a cation pump n=1 Tax=Microvirga lotononidis TaxID=864069 RepID=I4Z0P5_9HYPH|nr:FixH family protein [Microvirga lotononidis]EIM29787.1 putative integral membrane protein linked to a cation pump [Microvirga lotononidis]WQO26915.1 FixH family protein [Microvirga lotononidis]